MKLADYRKYIKLICYIFISFFIITCAEQFSSEFDTDKEFSISENDNDACLLLSDPLLADTTVVGTDTTISYLNYMPVSVANIDTTIEAVWVNAHDTLIQALFDTLLANTINSVENPGNNTISYALFQKENSGEENTYFYFSWDLTSQNLDAFITLDIFNKSGEKIRLQAEDIELETIAGCTENVELVGTEGVFPKIRARFQYNLPEDFFLLRFSNTAPAQMGNFRVVIF